jgi:hypothetical protein
MRHLPSLLLVFKVSATVTAARMPPPCWLTVVSLLKVARRVFDAPGNRLRWNEFDVFCGVQSKNAHRVRV